ncbi:hypothetical protein AB0D66_22205 [Streptomyces sp. NPDC048270]|uniref:hypothetical protein n=1 Tax=Streptomyces sp. NPDC048270 TaxID=3154615 RepID=UPI0033D1ADDA
MCLSPADDYEECAIYLMNAVVSVVRAAITAQFPPLELPDKVELFAIGGSGYGPYEALRVTRSRWWGPWDSISVSRQTAERIAADVNTWGADDGLTAEWKADWLVITWTARYRGMLSADARYGRPGREVVEPGADGRYSLRRLWWWTPYESIDQPG